MSVIANALKAAQRQKQRAESGGASGVPVLVPLRGSAGSDAFSWGRAVMLGVGGALTFGVIWFGVQRARTSGVRSMPAPPPVLSTDIAVAPSSPAPIVAPRSASAPSPEAAPARSDTSVTSSGRARPATRTSVPPVRRLPATKNDRQVAAVLQSAGTDSSPSAVARPASALRIAVDRLRDPTVAEIFAAGVAAHRAGDLPTAKSAYERVLTIAPGDVDALNNLGVLLLSVRDLDRAEVMLRKAVTLAPRNASAWNNLGTVLRDRGQTPEAIAAYQRALAIDPRHTGARISLAQQYLAIGSLAQARDILEDVVAANPSAAEAQYTLGQVYELLGDRASALRAYGAFVRVAPPRLAAHVERVQRRIDELSARK